MIKPRHIATSFPVESGCPLHNPMVSVRMEIKLSNILLPYSTHFQSTRTIIRYEAYGGSATCAANFSCPVFLNPIWPLHSLKPKHCFIGSRDHSKSTSPFLRIEHFTRDRIINNAIRFYLAPSMPPKWQNKVSHWKIGCAIDWIDAP